MGNAIWLLRALPEWFFESIRHPIIGGPLSAIPAFGVVCLAVGVVLGFARRQEKLLLFLLSPIASEVLVAISGIFRGRIPEGGDGSY
jgi:hypothetical protein